MEIFKLPQYLWINDSNYLKRKTSVLLGIS